MGNNRISDLVKLSDSMVEASKAISDHLEQDFVKRMKEIELGLAVRMEKRLEEMAEKHVSDMKELRSYYEQVIEGHHNKSLEEIKTLMQAMPVPQVHLTIPSGAIEVKQLPANVSITLPPEAIKVEQQPVNVTIPEKAIRIEQLPANVSVNVPENAIQVKQLPVQVNIPKDAVKVEVKQLPADKAVKFELAQPKRIRKVEKSIIYGATGRPEKIVEEIKEE